MTKTRFGRSARGVRVRRAGPWWDSNPQETYACARPYSCHTNLVFVITFREKMSPGPKNGLERRPLRFSTICAKNQVLKLKIDKVTVILRRKSPFWAALPCTKLISMYRGFKPKGGGIRIITFRVTTRLQSKSNRCIWHTTLII
jgi:hypothetical protein